MPVDELGESLLGPVFRVFAQKLQVFHNFFIPHRRHGGESDKVSPHRLPRTHLINAVVGRVAPRAPSRNLGKGWLSLKIGRLGARGATRPTI